MIVQCRNAWCNGDKEFEVADERPDKWPPDYVWPPLNCPSCREWNNELGQGQGRRHMVVSCRNCLHRRHFTGERQIWLKKRIGVPAPQIEAGDLCPDCLEASESEREARSKEALLLRRSFEAHARARAKLRCSPEVLSAKRESQLMEYREYWRNRLSKVITLVRINPVRALVVDQQGMFYLLKDSGDAIRESWSVLERRLQQGSQDQRAAFAELVAHSAVDHIQLVRALGRPELPQEQAEVLPKALALVLSEHPSATGIFKAQAPYRGKRSTSLLSDIGSKDQPAGSAYEILGTVALMQREVRDRTGAGALGLYPNDRPHFGVKLQARYAGERTVEADLLIERKEFLGGHRSIGIDFKFTTQSSYWTREYELDRELKGARNAIRAREVDEFHFVTNKRFDVAFVTQVEKLNDELRATGDPPIRLYEYVTWS